jgi:hypothetical protein
MPPLPNAACGPLQGCSLRCEPHEVRPETGASEAEAERAAASFEAMAAHALRDGGSMSSVGIFRPTAGQGLASRTRKRRNRASPGLDAFAEALAETGDVALASVRCGVTLSYGRAMLQRIRKRLGWQAQ